MPSRRPPHDTRGLAQMSRCDVLIVGGGPAGACAAHELCKRGIRTIVLESKTTPGLPVRCGELIRPSSIGSPELAKVAMRGRQISRCAIVGPAGERFEFLTPDSAYAIRRDEFDAALLERARNSGADVRLQHHALEIAVHASKIMVKVGGAEGSATYATDHVVAADGVGGRIARLMGLFRALRLRNLAITATARLRCSETSDTAEINLNPQLFPGGYAWAFPLDDGLWNVGVGITAGRTSGLSVSDSFHQYISLRFPRSFCSSVAVGAIPATLVPRKVSTPFCTAIGDAGRIVSPSTGAGISLALNTGTEAGRRLGNGSDYSDFVHELYGPAIERGMQVRAVLSAANPTQIGQAIRTAQRTSSCERRSVSAAFDEVARGLPK
jgi:geranylgeranyl reductase family protein